VHRSPIHVENAQLPPKGAAKGTPGHDKDTMQTKILPINLISPNSTKHVQMTPTTLQEQAIRFEKPKPPLINSNVNLLPGTKMTLPRVQNTSSILKKTQNKAPTPPKTEKNSPSVPFVNPFPKVLHTTTKPNPKRNPDPEKVSQA
jgi:hypothetical protein